MGDVLSRIAACIACTCFFFLGTLKSLGAFQQCGYAGGRFVRWLRRKDNLYYNRLALWSGLSLLSTALVALVFSFAGTKAALLLSAVPFFFFCILFCIADRKYAFKVPLAITGRVRRLSAVYILLIACVSYIVIALLAFFGQLAENGLYQIFQFVPFTLMPLLLPWLLVVAGAIDGLYENPRNRRFVKKAGQVLNETQILRVAVVGSYGKTSVKNILQSILSARFSVIATPASYNTPVGIAKTVTSPEFAGKQVLIAEMGARRAGDIAELCDLVKPGYAAFTGVCAQHIETFGSEENVLKAKCEILKGTARKVVCGGALKEKIQSLPVETVSPADLEKCVFADFGNLSEGLELRADSTSFFLSLPDGRVFVQTCLLGRHSAENIALAALLASEMGLTAAEIEEGIARISPIPHRLQLIESGGVHILDDSYNSNPEGAAEAVEALLRFSGRKIVVTPGLVETGILDEALGRQLGARLAGLDLVILVGDTQVGAVKAGYLDAGGAEENLIVCPTLDGAKDLLSGALQKGDAVLFLNDLPDAW